MFRGDSQRAQPAKLYTEIDPSFYDQELQRVRYQSIKRRVARAKQRSSNTALRSRPPESAKLVGASKQAEKHPE